MPFFHVILDLGDSEETGFVFLDSEPRPRDKIEATSDSGDRFTGIVQEVMHGDTTYDGIILCAQRE